ncbi:MAG: type II secretion system protein [Minisyncoccia bacterium]
MKKTAQPIGMQGLTLIELLVVIAVIGILAAVVMASLNSARVKARDVRRIADMKNIYTALQLYYDQYGYLPMTNVYGEVNTGGWDYSSQGNFLSFLVTAGFFSSVPKDPVNNGIGDVFYSGSGYSYGYYCYLPNHSVSLGTRLERTNAVYWIASEVADFTCQ